MENWYKEIYFERHLLAHECGIFHIALIKSQNGIGNFVEDSYDLYKHAMIFSQSLGWYHSY